MTVTAVDDTTDAPDKEVTVSAAVSGDSGIAAPASVTLTIEDDEAAPEVTLAVTDSVDRRERRYHHGDRHAQPRVERGDDDHGDGGGRVAYTVRDDATIEIAAGETSNA